MYHIAGVYSMRITATRSHSISCGHRVHNHESKCANLHGHNYTIEITCAASTNALDEVGRVLDFSVIKSVCCQWLEDTWDHKFLMWTEDPWYKHMSLAAMTTHGALEFLPGLVACPFNPTAENMASYLVHKFTRLLAKDGHPFIECTHIRVIETGKCWADAELPLQLQDAR